MVILIWVATHKILLGADTSEWDSTYRHLNLSPSAVLAAVGILLFSITVLGLICPTDLAIALVVKCAQAHARTAKLGATSLQYFTKSLIMAGSLSIFSW
jgi:hypothetical protein